MKRGDSGLLRKAGQAHDASQVHAAGQVHVAGQACLAVAGLSARPLAEAASRAAHPVVALDLFGDRDTLAVARQWLPIGEAPALVIEAERFLAALATARDDHGASGWIPGPGFEDRPGLLAYGDRILPLLGNRPEVVASIKAPEAFFGLLDRHGIAHPPTRRQPPPSAPGWLSKRTGGCGGSHIHEVGSHAGRDDDRYYQARIDGLPMSALFAAGGRRARILGFNRLLVGRGPSAYRFDGAIGPVGLPEALTAAIDDALQAIVADTGLVGLNGLDFIRTANGFQVLEINPRYPASAVLHDPGGDGFPLRAHLAACAGSLLAPTGGGDPARVRGFRPIYAHRPLRLTEATCSALADTGWCHDIPASGSHFEPGQPVCTVSAVGPGEADGTGGIGRSGGTGRTGGAGRTGAVVVTGAAGLDALLSQRAEALLHRFEVPDD